MTHPPITDEMVERAARAAHDAEYDGDAYPWAEEPDSVKRQYRNMSRAALEAALSAHETKAGTDD